MTNQYDNETPMPADATRNMFVWVSGFGIGALLMLFGFVFLVGIGQLGHTPVSGPGTPAAQSAATAPTQPGPAPKPAPNTAGPTVPSTTGQAPAPAQPETKQKVNQAAPAAAK